MVIVMSQFKQFTVSSARKLPVIILADISGSMSINGKIETLNRAIAEMIASFAREEDVRAEIHVAVITFGGEEAKVHQRLLPADKIQWIDMEAVGRTPMGAAFDLVTRMVEDRNQIASRDYHPTLILVSDGQPNDDWKNALDHLLNSTRASKALRMSMGIGDDADTETLLAFLAGQDPNLFFRADETSQIRKFFRYVTMTMTTRSKSVAPDKEPIIDIDEFDDIEDLVF